MECNETINSEGYNAKHNGSDVVNSYGKEYSELKGTTLIGTIQKEDEQDEDSMLEVVYGWTIWNILVSKNRTASDNSHSFNWFLLLVLARK